MSSLFEIVASGGFGIAGGVLSGFLGIGGGAILPPLLVFTLGVDQHRAQGISLAALLPPVALPAVLAYRKSGIRVGVNLVLTLIVGFMVGVLGGAWLAHRVSSRELRWAFAAFLALSAWHGVLAKPGNGSDAAADVDPPRGWGFRSAPSPESCPACSALAAGLSRYRS